MDKDDRAGVQFKRAFCNLARIDRDMIDRAFRLFLIRDEDVLAVEVENAKLLHLQMGHGGVAIVQQSVPRGHDMPL